MSDFSRRNLLRLAAVGATTASIGITAGARTPVGLTSPGVGTSSPRKTTGPTDFRFGPTGRHQPTRTAAVDTQFDRTIEVNCTWAAIAGGITEAARFPTERVRVTVRPGTLGGNGNGSGAVPVLSNLGALGRASRILVTQRDGLGTVTFSNSFRIVNVRGVEFAGFWPFPHSINLAGVQDFAWAYSKVLSLNITGRVATTENIELVECVTPEAGLRNHDTWAFRTMEYEYRKIAVTGCYIAPSFKEAGSREHVDTLQLSGTRPQRDVTLHDTAIFASTNAGLIPSSAASNVLLDNSIIVGEDRMLIRFPLPAGANNFTSGYPIGVNGQGTTNVLSANDSIIVGSARGTWDNVTNTLASTTPSVRVTKGGFTINRWLVVQGASWIDARIPQPTDGYLVGIWSNLAALKAR